MKISKFIFTILFLILSSKVFSNEIDFEASNIELKDDGNKIFAINSKLKIPSENIEISSNKAEYFKTKKILKLKENIYLEDKDKNLKINSEKITYERKKHLFYSEGNTKINLEDKYILKSKNIFYDRKSQILYGSNDVLIEDIEKNIYKLKDGFKFDNLKKIIKSKKGYIIDNKNNKYIYEDLIIDLLNKRIVGKELKIEFEKSYFGNVKNEPVLKGRSGYSDENELLVYKSVFSTCNLKKKKCRGWEIQTDEFKHDKKKRIFEYKNTWLKIFDRKIFYFPYFNHPDPTVERKSGFLTPSYASSESFGTSINIPYFKVIDIDKDITFNPKIYADKSFLLQNEYRHALQNSNIISDFSFLIGDAGTKGHLFYNQNGNINNNTKFEINLQNVEGDNFLKNHNLSKTSKLINDDDLLLSNINLDWTFNDSNLSSSFKVYEDLTRNYHDRFQFIFPDFNFIKNIEIPESYNGKFSFNTYGFNKNYDTNVHEAVVTNDFLFNSNDFITKKGIVSNYNLLLKNSNTYSKNSQNFDEDSDYKLFGSLKFDSSLPLRKSSEKFIDYLTPILSMRYSPNNNTDLTNKDILLDYNSVFDLNRIGSNHEVEGGESLTLGLDLKRDELYSKKNIYNFKIANVLRINENSKLPKKSKLNEKRSDIFGNLNYNINENLKLGYKFSYDNNMKYSNLEAIDLEFINNKLQSNFTYYTEDFEIDNKESIKNNTVINFNSENKINFNLIKDLKNDYTQSYNINYEYLTDCLSLNFGFDKTFYSDGNLEPNQSISFLIKIIPFTNIGVSNIGNIMNN